MTKHTHSDQLARLALKAFSSSPAMQECSPKSAIRSIMTAAQLSMELGINEQCYPIPHRTRAFVPGLTINLAQRKGKKK